MQIMDKRLDELQSMANEILIKEATKSIKWLFQMDLDDKVELCTTPIEKYFTLGLICYLKQRAIEDCSFDYSYRFVDGSNENVKEYIDRVFRYIKETFSARLIITQYKVGKYTADFCIIIYSYNKVLNKIEEVKLIVECDGHDFHEKTKAQAQHDKKRDRFFQLEGYSVFRYTGRDLYTDPFEVAKEVIDFLENCQNQQDLKFRSIKTIIEKNNQELRN